jgi:hypothetical protein
MVRQVWARCCGWNVLPIKGLSDLPNLPNLL